MNLTVFVFLLQFYIQCFLFCWPQIDEFESLESLDEVVVFTFKFCHLQYNSQFVPISVFIMHQEMGCFSWQCTREAVRFRKIHTQGCLFVGGFPTNVRFLRSRVTRSSARALALAENRYFLRAALRCISEEIVFTVRHDQIPFLENSSVTPTMNMR